MRARAMLLCVSLLAGMAVGPHEVAAGTPDERPDIMVILIDDMPGIDDRVLAGDPAFEEVRLTLSGRLAKIRGGSRPVLQPSVPGTNRASR